MLHGISIQRVIQTLEILLGHNTAGLFHLPNEKEAVRFVVQLPRAERARAASLNTLTIASPSGRLVPLSELVEVETTSQAGFRYRKNLKILAMPLWAAMPTWRCWRSGENLT